jgi:hypothetical protein
MINIPLNKLREKATLRWAMENSSNYREYIVRYMDQSKVVNKPHIVIRTRHNAGARHVSP